MYLFEARRILGLSIEDSLHRAAILTAWKQKIRHAHPDKNTRAHDAKEQTQTLNEAKDTLLDYLCDPMEKEREVAREEAVAKEKEKAVKEAMRKQEEENIRKHYDDMFERIKAVKRARYALNRKKRAPGTRAHRKSHDCTEGVQLMEEMKGFIKDKFEPSMDFNDSILVCDILILFMETREHTTDLEKNLFQRHTRTIIQAAFPKASYTVAKNKRCYRYIHVKQ